MARASKYSEGGNRDNYESATTAYQNKQVKVPYRQGKSQVGLNDTKS